MRRAIVGALVIVVVAGLGQSVVAAAPSEARQGWIVVLDDSVANPAGVASEHARRYGAAVTHVYSHALKGYSATFSERGASDVAGDRRVAYVEADGTVRATTTQTPATWGLDRIDQRALPLSNSFSYTATGAGVTAYVIDTGIRTGHSEFATGNGTSRATVGTDTVNDGKNGQDCNGHGTHVAGTIGGNTYGVAKGVSLVAVRVLSCAGNGTTSGVIAGLDWAAGDHTTGAAVANMSLGGGASFALDSAVNRLVADGVAVAVAAGNGNTAGIAQDACKSSPARVTAAITVGATDSNDRKASWSNFGKCVDLFAPGVGITSAWSSGDAATNTISGTSMATPHTAGVAALYLEVNGVTPPATVQGALVSLSTTISASGLGKGSPNKLLFTNF